MNNLVRVVFMLFILLVATPALVFASDAEMDEFEAWEQSANKPSTDTNFGSEVPTARQLINSLKPVKTRSIRPNRRAKPKAISMEVSFPSDSFQLTAKTKKLLDVLGRALNADQLKGFKFIIEGHTDASGKNLYNLDLSEKRANSVRQYLVSKHGVSSKRLDTVGKGEKDLLDKDNPNGPRNRRVKIINLGL
jgi:OmpA-OmpF porin, OOP family